MLIASVAGVLAVIVLVAFWNGRKPKPDQNHCVEPVTASTVVVIDHSERMTTQTQDEMLSRALKHVKDKTAVNERITVFTINELSRKSLKPSFSSCRPPETGNHFTESVRLIERRFKQEFEAPLVSSLNVPLTDGAESPIAQAIIDLSLSEYLRYDRNTLLVFSDLLENTERFSMYRCSLGRDVVQRFRDVRVGAVERPKFKNTRVILNVIPRFDITREALKCRDYFWAWFFGDSEGDSSLDREDLPGGDIR